MAAILLIIVGGESITFGTDQAVWWSLHRPPAVAATLVYVSLWFAAHALLLPSWLALAAVGAEVTIFSVANRIKLSKLGLPIAPADLSMSHQFLDVARILWGDVVLWIAGLCALGVLALVVRFRVALAQWALRRVRRVPAAAAFAALAFGLAYVPDYSLQSGDPVRRALPEFLQRQSLLNYSWAPDTNVKLNGQLLAFAFNVRSAFVEKPAGYSREAVVRGLASLPGLAGAPVPDALTTDVVVIMNEAFWDDGVLPGVGLSDPLTGRARSSSRGSLFSPVFGGYTANTEFEFLTRLSLSYLPNGVVPYTEYMQRPMPSIVSEFREAGYRTSAIHPFLGSFYQRDHVYRALGFHRFVTAKDFNAPTVAGLFVSDASITGEVARTIEEAPDQKHFIFVVTMQNHGAYAGSGARYAPEQRVQLNDLNGRLSPSMKEALQVHATGVRDGVDFFNSVVQYFEHRRRKAVVVMFGDHLPGLGDNYAVYVDTGFVKGRDQNSRSDDEVERMHAVPLLGWTNAGRELPLPQKAVSPIFLATMVKRAAGLPDDPMDALLERLQGDYDVLSQFYSRRSDGATVRHAPQDTSATRLYRMVEYDLLVGKQHSAALLSEGSGD